MNSKKRKLTKARWLLVSGLMTGSLTLTGCSVSISADTAYEAIQEDNEDILSRVTKGFIKNGDNYQLYYSFISKSGYKFYDYETGELIGTFFGNRIYDSENNPIYLADQFIEFQGLDKNLDYSYEEAMEITDEMFENMFENYSENKKLGCDIYDVYKILNIETGEEFKIIGISLKNNIIFNLETCEVEDYSKCIVEKVDSYSTILGYTRNDFLKHFYEDHYPERMSELESKSR